MVRVGQGGLGLAQVMAAAALWATVGVASRLVPEGAGAAGDLLGVARMALGGPVILGLALVLGQAGRGALGRLQPLRLAGFALGCAVFQLCLFRAFTLLGVTATVFLTVCLPPLIACGWASLNGGRILSHQGWAALGLAVAGLALFALGRGVAGWAALAPGLGLAVLGSIAFVGMTECARDLTRAAGPLVVAGAGLTLAGLGLGLALLVMEPGSLAPERLTGGHLPLLVLYLGLGPTALAYVAYCAGMARCRSAHVGLIASMVEPALAAVLAFALLGERLAGGEMAGCALLTLAMALLWRAERG